MTERQHIGNPSDPFDSQQIRGLYLDGFINEAERAGEDPSAIIAEEFAKRYETSPGIMHTEVSPTAHPDRIRGYIYKTSAGEFSLHPFKGLVSLAQDGHMTEANLSQIEMQLLQILISNAGLVLSEEKILEELGKQTTSNFLPVHMTHLRSKLGKLLEPDTDKTPTQQDFNFIYTIRSNAGRHLKNGNLKGGYMFRREAKLIKTLYSS